ncbi:MAG: hypothetical protein LBL49_02605 [Clostridiales Family XIII bacterium]|jgi:hypothetical protein|nr:hypothetical protein [Clostridiales Family XIII bacterium]
MKRKILIPLAVLLLTVPIFLAAVSAADDASDFTLALNRADGTVTVVGTGYEPGEMVSLMASFNKAQDYQNMDYVDQLTADGGGDFTITFPTKDGELLGGQTYFVALNGEVKSEQLYATQVKANPSARISLRLRSSYQLDYLIDGVAYEFVSGNPSIVRVDETGKLTPVRAGTAVISLRATDGSGLTSSVTVSVTP